MSIATRSVISRVDSTPGARPAASLFRAHKSSDLAQPALRVGWRDIRPAGQTRHEEGRVPVRFAAAGVSGYRLGCRKSGVMNGTKRCDLLPD